MEFAGADREGDLEQWLPICRVQQRRTDLEPHILLGVHGPQWRRFAAPIPSQMHADLFATPDLSATGPGCDRLHCLAV